MASSLTSSELISLMDSDVDEYVSDPHLMESPTHVFRHNLPEYVVIDVDPTTVVNNLQDESFFHPYLYENSSIHCNSIVEIHSNAIHDSQSGYIPQLALPRSIIDDDPNIGGRIARGDTDALTVFTNHLKEIKSNILDKGHRDAEAMEADDTIVEELIGQPIDVEISITNPDGIRNKDCGKHHRIIGPAES
ncbi:hypothetical protein L1987_13921 [Smallanthus sonchifolius]|uniref:Uncharacterized protein n=1 Tax=Smallanthus sonchifolius TaxID=185202 RepID=A0ACB9JIE4_9ASTR|nr:hypothetical protein L1987_13921 [Smallanthus sonchifolius]